jgi:glycosyltransferase involved in cell wall biosynthesis
MASGIPVIASSTEGPAEILSPNQAGLLFETGNAVDLFLKIQFAYSNQPVVKEMAERAYQEAKKYSIQKTLEYHSRLYQRLTANRFLNVVFQLKSTVKTSLNLQASQ